MQPLVLLLESPDVGAPVDEVLVLSHAELAQPTVGGEGDRHSLIVAVDPGRCFAGLVGLADGSIVAGSHERFALRSGRARVKEEKLYECSIPKQAKYKRRGRTSESGTFSRSCSPLARLLGDSSPDSSNLPRACRCSVNSLGNASASPKTRSSRSSSAWSLTGGFWLSVEPVILSVVMSMTVHHAWKIHGPWQPRIVPTNESLLSLGRGGEPRVPLFRSLTSSQVLWFRMSKP